MDARRLQDVVNEFYSKGLITKASQRARIIWSMTNNKQVSTLCQNITTYLEKIDGKNDTKLALDAILFLFKEINKFKQNEQNSSAQKNINDLTLILTTDLNMDPKNDNTWEEAQAKLAIQNPLSSTASTVTIATSGLKNKYCQTFDYFNKFGEHLIKSSDKLVYLCQPSSYQIPKQSSSS